MMMLKDLFFFYLSVMIVGAINTELYRIWKREKVSDPWNCFCENCGNKLTAIESDLPVINYILLGGKTYCCKKKISLWHPITELTGGIVLYIFLRRLF